MSDTLEEPLKETIDEVKEKFEENSSANEKVAHKLQTCVKDHTKKALSAYHNALIQRPIATKALTSGIISALGDILATWKGGSPRNIRRTLAFFIFGGVITGPVCHYWYGFLESKLARLKGASNIAAKVALDKILFTPPFLGLTLFILRLLESGRIQQAVSGTRQVYFSALKTNLKVWTIAQAINFTYVPPAYRVLFGNIVALWWSFYLSTSNSNTRNMVLVKRSY